MRLATHRLLLVLMMLCDLLGVRDGDLLPLRLPGGALNDALRRCGVCDADVCPGVRFGGAFIEALRRLQSGVEPALLRTPGDMLMAMLRSSDTFLQSRYSFWCCWRYTISSRRPVQGQRQRYR